MIDHEAVYQLVYEQRWSDLLDVLHVQHTAVADDALLAHAADTFVSTFFGALNVTTASEHTDLLEKLFLLHTGGFYELPPSRFEQVVEALVHIHAHHPDVAVGYARFYPSNPHCAVLLAAQPVLRPARGSVTACSSHGQPNAVISLFKSRQEVDFFLAVREVFATYFVYPNVALSCLIDYERIQDQLTGAERRYFFRGIVDCVVFDQHDAYRPRYFFELDSPLHDVEARQENDRYKDRILSLAGQTLYRIRQHGSAESRSGFVTLLKKIVAGEYA